MSVVQFTLPMFIGAILNWLLFGVLLVQIYIYFAAFSQDRGWWKTGVVAILVLEIVRTAANTHDMALKFGYGWGDMQVLRSLGLAWFSIPIMGSLIAFIGQLFFSYRIYVIAQNLYISGFILTLGLVQLSGAIWLGVNIYLAGRFAVLQGKNLVPSVLWLVGTALCDLIIVFTTVYYLTRAREPRLGKMSSGVSRIIMLTVETGAICAIFALADFYLFVAFKDTAYHVGVCTELSKIYSNSILLIFNSRVRFGHAGSQITTTCGTLADSVYRSAPTTPTTFEFPHSSSTLPKRNSFLMPVPFPVKKEAQSFV